MPWQVCTQRRLGLQNTWWITIPASFMASPTNFACTVPITVRGQSLEKPSGPSLLAGTDGGMFRSFRWYLPSLSKLYGIQRPKVKSTLSPWRVMKTCLGPRGLQEKHLLSRHMDFYDRNRLHVVHRFYCFATYAVEWFLGTNHWKSAWYDTHSFKS